jgi:hypothetical protein
MRGKVEKWQSEKERNGGRESESEKENEGRLEGREKEGKRIRQWWKEDGRNSTYPDLAWACEYVPMPRVTRCTLSFENDASWLGVGTGRMGTRGSKWGWKEKGGVECKVGREEEA